MVCLFWKHLKNLDWHKELSEERVLKGNKFLQTSVILKEPHSLHRFPSQIMRSACTSLVLFPSCSFSGPFPPSCLSLPHQDHFSRTQSRSTWWPACLHHFWLLCIGALDCPPNQPLNFQNQPSVFWPLNVNPGFSSPSIIRQNKTAKPWVTCKKN